LLARNCAYLRREGQTVFLGLDRRSESLLAGSRKSALADALTAHFGEKLKVEISLQDSQDDVATPLQEQALRDDARLDAARQSLEADPNVRAMKDMFGAELQPGSIEIIERKP
jgi:DNA polymerase-3 subunit gamma/tau